MDYNKEDTKSVTQHWMVFLLGLVSLLLLFWGLGRRDLWGSEGRWAEITREMFLTGDFFHPTIGGEPYFDKPLLTYWLITGVSALTGTLNEWVVRLPSAIFGFTSIWATVILGRRLWSVQVGCLAGWLLLTSYGVLFWSRTAAADTENLAAITLCILWYWVRRDRPNFKTFLIFYLIACLGALTKGLTAVVVPIVAILPDLVLEKRWKALLRPSHFLALAVALGVYLTPFVYASMSRPQDYHSSGLGLVFQENILRYFRAFDHEEPFYIYLYAVPLLVLPWAPLLVTSLIGLLPIWKDLDKRTRWLIAATAMIFLFFTLSDSRRKYYILPITPLCALLMAVFLLHVIHDRAILARRWGMKIQKYVCMGVIGFEIVLPFILLILKMRNSFGFFVELGVSGVIVGGAAWFVKVIADKQSQGNHWPTHDVRPIAGLIATAVIIFGGFFFWQQHAVDNFRTERSFIEEVKSQTNGWPAAHIGFFPKNDAKLLFYLDKSEPTLILKNPSDWDQFLSDGQPKLLIMQSKYGSRVPPDYAAILRRQPDIAEKTEPWDSTSSRKNKWVAWFLNNERNQVSLNAIDKDQISNAN